MSFWVSTAELNGTRTTNSEVELQPGPSRIEYPGEAAGSYLDTTDGSVIQQQPARDGRRRVWLWENYPGTQVGWMRIWPLLEGLRARFRAENGLSPFVYLMEDVPKGLRQRNVLTSTGSGSGFTFTDGGASWGSLTLRGGSITVAGQTRAIIGNTATTLSIGDAFIGTPSGAYVLSYWSYPWFKARILDVSQQVNDSGPVRYVGKVTFVVDSELSQHLVG